MKPKKLNPLILAAATVPILAGNAQAAVLTDFSTFSESLVENTRPQAFSTTTGVGTNSIIATAGTISPPSSAFGQDVFLSDSFSLATVGSRISVSLGSFVGTANTSQSIGLAVASSEANTGRNNMIIWFFGRNATQEVRMASFNAVGTPLAVANHNINGASLTYPDSIFIERTLTGYDLGWITGVTPTVLHNLVIGGNATANGTAVGIYSDVRHDDSINTLVNFAHIPEPSSALLGGLGLLALLRRRRA